MQDIQELDNDELRKVAERYKVTIPARTSREQMEDMVLVGMEKHRLALEQKAKAERQMDLERQLGVDPQTKSRPSPETIAIANSEKVYAIFTNLDEDGVDEPFNVGGQHPFHLWCDFIHVLPKCVIDEIRNPNTPTGTKPQYARRPHPTIPNLQIDTVVGNRKKCAFEILDLKPPTNAKFGVVLDRKIYEKTGTPFPQPVVAA